MADPGNLVDCHLACTMRFYAPQEQPYRTLAHLRQRFPHFEEVTGFHLNGKWICDRWDHLIATRAAAYRRFTGPGSLDAMEEFREAEGF